MTEPTPYTPPPPTLGAWTPDQPQPIQADLRNDIDVTQQSSSVNRELVSSIPLFGAVPEFSPSTLTLCKIDTPTDDDLYLVGAIIKGRVWLGIQSAAGGLTPPSDGMYPYYYIEQLNGDMLPINSAVDGTALIRSRTPSSLGVKLCPIWAREMLLKDDLGQWIVESTWDCIFSIPSQNGPGADFLGCDIKVTQVGGFLVFYARIGIDGSAYTGLQWSNAQRGNFMFSECPWEVAGDSPPTQRAELLPNYWEQAPHRLIYCDSGISKSTEAITSLTDAQALAIINNSPDLPYGENGAVLFNLYFDNIYLSGRQWRTLGQCRYTFEKNVNQFTTIFLTYQQS